MRDPEVNERGLYVGGNSYVEETQHTHFGGVGFSVMWRANRQQLGTFVSKEVANGIAATFDALAQEGYAPTEPPIEALLELVGFRQILADVVSREAKRLGAEELATRKAADRLRGRSWP